MARRSLPARSQSSISNDSRLFIAQRCASPESSSIAADVATVAGVGPRRRAALHARQIVTLADALSVLPHRYEDLRRRDDVTGLCPGMTAVVEGILQNVTDRPMLRRRSRRIATAFLKQESGKGIRAVWFNLRSGSLPSGEWLVLAGRVSEGPNGDPELIHPDIYRLRGGAIPAIRPVYPLPPEISQRLFASIIDQSLQRASDLDADAIPLRLRAQERLWRIVDALKYLHRPPSDANFDELQNGRTTAHRALAFDEMFTFQVALSRERARRRNRAGAVLNGPTQLTNELLASLPFALTASQLRAISEISAELAAPSQMNRILIGDVGSGKTMVAFHAALRAVESGWQAAIMAPTEILAEQHFANFKRICGRVPITAALLTGNVSARERTTLLRALKLGEISIVFGTHALAQERVTMQRLGIAIIDEQHRFGVFDRARLVALGSEANVLLMTATPIPRSLAMVLFRNLEISALDEVPPGRVPVATEVLSEESLRVVDSQVQAELEQGRRAYYVLPMIDGEEDPDSVIATAKRLRTGPLRRFTVGILHGRMRPAERDEVMRQFRDGTVQAIVSTTVVEVGIDVPEASIIAIIAAERYGLAQLHQLRGRVGRGQIASQCYLVVSRNSGPEARARIERLAHCKTGAEVANLDLRLRGPGDLLGARQTGALPLRFARFIHDIGLLMHAGELADAWLQHDPELASEESSGTRAALARMLEFGFSLGDVG